MKNHTLSIYADSKNSMDRTMDNPLIEKAIKFLAKKIDTFSSNPKPVVYHSIRVGMLLINQ